MSRAETFLEGFKLGDLGVSKPKSVETPLERKHNPVDKKTLKVKWGHSFTVPEGHEPRTYMGKRVYAYATWEQGMQDQWVHHWKGPLEYDEDRYSRDMVMEMWVDKDPEDFYYVVLEIFYNYDKTTDMFEDHVYYITNQHSQAPKLVLDEFERLSKRAKANGLIGIGWPLDWSLRK